MKNYDFVELVLTLRHLILSKIKKTKLQIEDEEIFTINECGSGELVGYGF